MSATDPYLDQLFKDQRDTDNLPRLYEGVVVNNPDPGEGIICTLPGYDADLQYGPMPYHPRSDAEPRAGFSCLVAVSSDQQYWCVSWWPGALADSSITAGIHTGHGSPSAGIGRDGEYYLNKDNQDLYGPKVGLVWGSPTNLVGPVGPTGAAGADGAHGLPGETGPRGPGGSEVSYTQFVAPVTAPVVAEASAALLVSAPALQANGDDVYDIEFFCPYANPNNTAGAFIYIVLFDGTSSLGFHWLKETVAVGGSADYDGIYFKRRIVPTTGFHTYSARAFAGVLAGTIGAGPGGAAQYAPGYIRITKNVT